MVCERRGEERSMSIGIGKKLYIGFGGIMILVALVGLAAWQSNKTADFHRAQDVDQIYGAVHLANAESALWQLRYGLPQFMVLGAEGQKRIVDDEPKWYKEVEDNINAYATGNRTAAEKEALKEWNESFAKYKQARPRWFELQGAGKTQEAAEWRAQNTTPFGASSVKALRNLIGLQRKVGDERERESLASSKWWRNVILGLLFFILAAGITGVVFATRSIVSPIQWVVEGLTQGAEQVSSASGQISQASQHVAQGTSEQASDIEEVSSSLEEIASITKQNSDNAQQAKVVMNEAGQIIKKVQYHMSQMGQAIGEITALSEETSKIIKTIDEIAFQTNLLALNAAVEAARAGEAGAGFSVVANEVRNLAMKASEAAKNTSHLVENTIKAVKKGNELTQSTQDAFRENIEIAVKHTRLIDEIAVASQEQAQGIEQVANAVVQMNQVTQANAASAEESASAGEELNAQVEQVKGMIQELIAIAGNSNGVHNGSGQLAKKAKDVVERLHHTTVGLFHPGPEESRVQVTAPPLKQKQSKPKKVTERKRTAHKDPEELIPFHEGKEKDEKVLRHF